MSKEMKISFAYSNEKKWDLHHLTLEVEKDNVTVSNDKEYLATFKLNDLIQKDHLVFTILGAYLVKQYDEMIDLSQIRFIEMPEILQPKKPEEKK